MIRKEKVSVFIHRKQCWVLNTAWLIYKRKWLESTSEVCSIIVKNQYRKIHCISSTINEQMEKKI